MDRGLINRLDFETSGVIFYAKSQSTHQFIRQNFNQAVKAKRYLAIISTDKEVNGSFNHSYFAPKGAKKVSISEYSQSSAQKACIEVSTLEYDSSAGLALVQVLLHQGKRHQIRAQLSFLGFPILGDQLYAGQKADRIFLHCLEYEINYLSKLYRILSPKPSLFSDFFDLDRSL